MGSSANETIAGVLVQPRTEAHLDACELIARTVQKLDGYPPHPPRGLRRFVADPDALGSWVAEVHGKVVGHIAIHTTSSEPVMLLATEFTSIPVQGLSVVARLFVGPENRRQGVADALLAVAVDASHALGRRPVLDVASHFEPAVALYEKHGWIRAGEVVVPFRGRDLHEFVYVGPPG